LIIQNFISFRFFLLLEHINLFLDFLQLLANLVGKLLHVGLSVVCNFLDALS